MNKTFAALAFGIAAMGAAPLDLSTDVDMSGPPQTAVFVERDFAPGQSSGLHIHHGVEMNVVVEGEVRVTVQGRAPRSCAPATASPSRARRRTRRSIPAPRRPR